MGKGWHFALLVISKESFDARNRRFDGINVGSQIPAVRGRTRARRPLGATGLFLMTETWVFGDTVFQIAHLKIFGT